MMIEESLQQELYWVNNKTAAPTGHTRFALADNVGEYVANLS